MHDEQAKSNPQVPWQKNGIQQEDAFHQQTVLTPREELPEMLHLERRFVQLGHFRKPIRNTWKVVTCGARERRGKSVGPIV
jgi:hypothetical protein